MPATEPTRGERPPVGLVLVDGSNVRRSGWPNASEQELVLALAAWRGTLDVDIDVVVVFDTHQVVASASGVAVVCVPYADDELVRLARERVDAGGHVRVATSDRELRARLEAVGAEVAWGGGRLLRELGLARR